MLGTKRYTPVKYDGNTGSLTFTASLLIYTPDDQQKELLWLFGSIQRHMIKSSGDDKHMLRLILHEGGPVIFEVGTRTMIEQIRADVKKARRWKHPNSAFFVSADMIRSAAAQPTKLPASGGSIMEQGNYSTTSLPIRSQSLGCHPISHPVSSQRATHGRIPPSNSAPPGGSNILVGRPNAGTPFFGSGSVGNWVLNPWVDGRHQKRISLQIHLHSGGHEVSHCVSAGQDEYVLQTPISDALLGTDGLDYLFFRVNEAFAWVDDMNKFDYLTKTHPRFVARQKSQTRLQAMQPGADVLANTMRVALGMKCAYQLVSKEEDAIFYGEHLVEYAETGESHLYIELKAEVKDSFESNEATAQCMAGHTTVGSPKTPRRMASIPEEISSAFSIGNHSLSSQSHATRHRHATRQMGRPAYMEVETVYPTSSNGSNDSDALNRRIRDSEKEMEVETAKLHKMFGSTKSAPSPTSSTAGATEYTEVTYVSPKESPLSPHHRQEERINATPRRNSKPAVTKPQKPMWHIPIELPPKSSTTTAATLNTCLSNSFSSSHNNDTSTTSDYPEDEEDADWPQLHVQYGNSNKERKKKERGWNLFHRRSITSQKR